MELRRLTLAVCVISLFATATAQLSDCELSDLFDGVTLEREMIETLRTGDNPTDPDITVLRNRTVCLSVGPTRGNVSSVSLVIEYTCEGSSLCPSGGQGIEQFDFGCNQGEWIYNQFGDVDNGRTSNPTANFSTTLRMDCGACFPVHPSMDDDSPTIDPVTHCHECRGCSNVGQMACYGSDADQCCNVYVNDMCADNCPSDGNYVLRKDDFVCTQVCDDLGDTTRGGSVAYSLAILDGSYPEGSVATVSCDEGYTGGGDITCASGSWSGSLPNCTVIDCGEPPVLDNGKVQTLTGTTFGSTATYECNDNYLFVNENVKSRTCQANGTWSNDDIKCEPCNIPDCSECVIEDGKFVCVECSEDFEKSGNDKCERISGNRDDELCLLCIILPIVAVILAIIAAIAIAVAIYVYRKWKSTPAIKLKDKEANGLNGVARDNPLYLDPSTVEQEVG